MLRHTLIFLRERQTHAQTDYFSCTSTVTAHSTIWLAETSWQLDRCSRGGTHGRLEHVRSVFSMSAFWLHEQESCHSRSHRQIPWNRRGAAWARDRMRRQNSRTRPKSHRCLQFHTLVMLIIMWNANQTRRWFTLKPGLHLHLICFLMELKCQKWTSKSSEWYLSIIKPYPLTLVYQYNK